MAATRLTAAQERPQRQVLGRVTMVAYRSDSVLASSLLVRAAANDSFPGLPRPRDSVLVVIAPDGAAFRDAIGNGAPEWGAAFAWPAERRIVMQGRSAPSSAGDPIRVLRHELAHLALHEHLGGAVPRWFDEGYASFAAQEWDREQVLAANIGLALGGFRTFAALDSGFLGGSRRAEAAYALSYRAVAELAQLDSERGLTLLFKYWRESRSLDAALRRGYGLTLSRFEDLWRSRTRSRYGGLALFADVSLGALVLLLMVGPLYVARRRRDRERMARMRAAEAEQDRREREQAIQALLDSVNGSVPPPSEGSAPSS